MRETIKGWDFLLLGK